VGPHRPGWSRQLGDKALAGFSTAHGGSGSASRIPQGDILIDGGRPGRARTSAETKLNSASKLPKLSWGASAPVVAAGLALGNSSADWEARVSIGSGRSSGACSSDWRCLRAARRLPPRAQTGRRFLVWLRDGGWVDWEAAAGEERPCVLGPAQRLEGLGLGFLLACCSALKFGA